MSSNAMRLGGKNIGVDMTQGSIFSHLLRFALPLMLGNLFQQLYNTVDTWVVGNFVSNEAFSAVGAVAPIVNMLIGAFSGLATGTGVVISQNFGAGRKDKVSDSSHTALVLTFIMAALFTAVGLIMAPSMLQLMNLHESARDEALTYLNIYFGGLTCLLIYNMGAGILRAIGDSRRPFYYLVACALVNTGLDLLFVIVFNMGVAGVALATVIAQGVSALLVIVTLLVTKSPVRITPKKLRIHWDLLKKILLLGIPAGLQMAITAFSNVFVQSYITHFDVGLPAPDYMSGWTAYIKVDQLIFLPMQSVALAVTTFVGQNLGAGLPKRARKGVACANLMTAIVTIALTIPVVVFAPQIVSFFNDKPEVIETGTLFLRVLTPFYMLCGFNQVYSSALRGSGNSIVPMIMMLSSFVLFRQAYLFIMSQICNQVIPISMSYPAGWLLCTVLTAVYFHTAKLEKTRLVDENSK